MGFIGSTLGLTGGNGGGAGQRYQAQGANLIQPTGQGQLNAGYTDAERGLAQQIAFLNAIQNQNGLGNQSSVFNQQQALANQLQGVANGAGPNPALAQLQNTTGQNVAAQAALMAGQRGTSANAGLLARQAAMQGANLQQQAVGQGAALSAQQQLSGMNALQQQQNLMASLANQQVGNQAGALSTYNQAAQSEQQNLLGATGNFNNAQVGMQSNINNANSGVAQVTAKAQSDLAGGLLYGVGSALPVPKLADGGEVDSNGTTVITPQGTTAPKSFIGRFMQGASASPDVISSSNPSPFVSSPSGPSALEKGSQNFSKGLAGGLSSLFSSGAVDSMLPEGAADLAIAAASKGGAIVPGKASIQGNSLKNDTVPAMLSPKEIVLPRSVTLAPDAPEKAKQFVAAVLAKQGMKRKTA